MRAALAKVPRHRFVPPRYADRAYDNRPLPIGHDQTISQPTIVALMTELAEPKATDRVLEIGTGSGYQAAVLAELAARVYTIEIVAPLGEAAAELLRSSATATSRRASATATPAGRKRRRSTPSSSPRRPSACRSR